MLKSSQRKTAAEEGQPEATDMSGLPQLWKKVVVGAGIAAVATGITLAGYLGIKYYNGMGAKLPVKQAAGQVVTAPAKHGSVDVNDPNAKNAAAKSIDVNAPGAKAKVAVAKAIPASKITDAESALSLAQSKFDEAIGAKGVAGRWELKDFGVLVLERNADGSYSGISTQGPTSVKGVLNADEFTFDWETPSSQEKGTGKIKITGNTASGSYTSQGRGGGVYTTTGKRIDKVSPQETTKKFSDAIIAYQDVIKIDPNSVIGRDAIEGLGDTYFEWSKASGNKTLLDQAIKWHQKYLDALKAQDPNHQEIPTAQKDLVYDYLTRNKPGQPATAADPNAVPVASDQEIAKKILEELAAKDDPEAIEMLAKINQGTWYQEQLREQMLKGQPTGQQEKQIEDDKNLGRGSGKIGDYGPRGSGSIGKQGPRGTGSIGDHSKANRARGGR